MEITIPIAFIIGFFSGIHCLGMCGSITSALTLSLPGEIKSHHAKLALFVSTYSLGRILSYALAGGIFGLIGGQITDVTYLQWGHEIARILASLVVIAVGFYLTGWLPQLRLMERLGEPIWRFLEPIGRRMLPIRNLSHALLFGLIWGWIPCGLVYYVLILTLSSGSALNGALCMLSFGFGTLPAMLSIGFLAGWVSKLSRKPLIRQIAGMVLIGSGIAWMLFGANVALNQM